MYDSIIKVSNALKYFDGIRAVNGIDLEVRKGEVYGLIGHNGAGKSTLIKIMLGLIKPDSGEVHIMGRPAHGEGFREVRRSIGYLPENIFFYPNLSGLETMQFFAGLKGADTKSCFKLLEKVGLGGVVRRQVRGYSRGMCQRLGFAQALLGNPRILFLDEPTSGLDPGGIREFYDMLSELKLDGVTVILSSHNLAEIQSRLDRLALMRLGNLQAAGTVQELHDTLTLPVQIRLSFSAEGDTAVQNLLSGFSGCSLNLDGTQGTIMCASGQKMKILSALMSLPGVVDVHIREPSLEDVYLGYADNSDAVNNHAQN